MLPMGIIGLLEIPGEILWDQKDIFGLKKIQKIADLAILRSMVINFY